MKTFRNDGRMKEISAIVYFVLKQLQSNLEVDRPKNLLQVVKTMIGAIC